MGEVISMLRERLEGEQQAAAVLERARREYLAEHPGAVDVVAFFLERDGFQAGGAIYCGPRILKKPQQRIDVPGGAA